MFLYRLRRLLGRIGRHATLCGDVLAVPEFLKLSVYVVYHTIEILRHSVRGAFNVRNEISNRLLHLGIIQTANKYCWVVCHTIYILLFDFSILG